MSEFAKILFKGIFTSYNSLAAYIGIVLFFGSWAFTKTKKWEGKMKKKIEAISLPYRLLILFGFIFISVILTSYSMYSEKQNKINKLERSNRPATKQEIRTFLESINSEILHRTDKGSSKILTTLSASKHIELVNLSKQPDFNKYLSFKHISREEDEINDLQDPNIFIEGDEFLSWDQAYYLYIKDALRK